MKHHIQMILDKYTSHPIIYQIPNQFYSLQCRGGQTTFSNVFLPILDNSLAIRVCNTIHSVLLIVSLLAQFLLVSL